MTEQEKMLAGKIYDSSDETLLAIRTKAHKLCQTYNQTADTEEKAREQIMRDLIPDCAKGVYLQGPIYFDYGKFTTIGENTFANFNFTVLDTCPVHIGNNVFIGPNVSLVTPMHPFRYQERNIKFRQDGTAYDDEYAKPITIGDNCWLGGGVTVCPNVTIGQGCVIGAGSVVTRDIPPHSLAVGSPCRVLRSITESDSIHLHPEYFTESTDF